MRLRPFSVALISSVITWRSAVVVSLLAVESWPMGEFSDGWLLATSAFAGGVVAGAVFPASCWAESVGFTWRLVRFGGVAAVVAGASGGTDVLSMMGRSSTY